MCKVHEYKPKLVTRHLCIKNPYSSTAYKTTLAVDYYGKHHSTAIQSYIEKCSVNLYCAKRRLILPFSRGLRGMWHEPSLRLINQWVYMMRLTGL